MAYTQPEKEYIQRLFQAQPSLTNDDIRQLINKRRENESQGKSNRAPQKGILGAMEKFNQFVNTNPIARESRNIGAGAIQAGGEVSAGLLGQLSRLAPGDQSADQSSFYNQTQRLLGNTKKDMQSEGINTEGLAYGAGKGIMNIAAGSVGAGLLGKGISAAAKTKMLSNLGIKVAQASPTAAKYGSNVVQGLAGGANKGNLVQRSLGGAATGLREGLSFDLASGNAPGAGTVGGAVIGGALPVVGAGLKATGNYLSRTLPGNLQLQGLMNPAKVTMLKKQLQTEGVTSPQDVGKWMLDRGIKGNKETIINTLISWAEKSKQAVDDSLSAIKKTVFSPVAKKALQQTYDDMAKVAGLEDDAAKVLKLLKKDKYTLSELNGVKRILDDQYNLFTKTGDPTAGLKAKGLQTIRQQLRKTIEEVASEAGVKNIRALNNETQIARTMADAIARKDSADAVREALTAFAPTGVGGIIGGVAGPFDNSTIEGKVGNVLLGMLAGKVLGSTTLKTNVASLLNKLSKKEISALDAYIKSGGKGNLPSQIIEKMEAMKLLPPPSGMPVSGNVVDVKPMTGFSPGILSKDTKALSQKSGLMPRNLESFKPKFDTKLLSPGKKNSYISPSVSDVSSIKGFSPGVLQKQSQAISSKVGTQPLTTQQSLQSGATSLLGNKIGLESGKKVSPLKKLKTNADIIGKKTVNAKTPQTKPLSQKSEVKYSKPDSLVQEAKKYKSAEEFVKAQETLYHGTQAVKAKDYTAIESKMKDIYKKLGHEYKESDSVKIVGNAEELVAKRSNEKLSKVQSEIADLQELLSRKISKPSSKFAGSSNKDVRDNSLGSFLTPDRDFAGRFTYDISYDLAGRKTIQQKNGYLVENYFKGDTLDLSKASDYDLDFLSKTLNMPKKDIVAELKTKGGTKEIQKKLAPKKDIISKEYDAVSNYAYDSEAKKWKKEIAVINDEALYTKQQLLDIYNKANKK